MARGIYGQNEGNETNINAGAEVIADVDSEGVWEGFKTEAQYREAMANHAADDIIYQGMEKGAKDGLTVRVARIKQTSALTALATVAEEMLAEGFSLDVMRRNLNAAPAVAYVKGIVRAKRVGMECDEIAMLKMRGKKNKTG